MVYTFTFQHTYKYPWELVVHTHLTKYPTKKEPNIVECCTVEARKGPGTLFYLKMIVSCLNVLPSVFRKWKALDVDRVLYEEDCWLDIPNRTLKLVSRPLAFHDYAVMEESSIFEPDINQPNWTQFRQQGTVEIRGLGSMSWILERFSYAFLSKGARRNVVIMEELMQERLGTFQLQGAP